MLTKFNLNRGVAAALLFSISFTACDKKDDPVKTGGPVDPTDAAAVTTSLNIPNAVLKDGNPPAPSSDPEAPYLYADDYSTSTIAGYGFNLDVAASASSVQGIYLKVQGADQYFDISLADWGQRNAAGDQQKRAKSDLKSILLKQFSSKQQRNEESEFEIPIPDSFSRGEFCANYCVYDAQNRVSNVVEVCVTIGELGGENSAFLTANAWQAIATRLYLNGELDYEEVIGEPRTEERTAPWLNCNPELVFTEKSTTNSIDLILSSNGGVEILSSYTDELLDDANTSCETGPAYITEDENYRTIGAWSYFSDDKNLIMYLDEDGEQYSVSLQAEMVNGQLILFEEESEYNEDTQQTESWKDEIIFGVK